MDRLPVTITNALSLGVSFGLSGICYFIYRKSLTRVDEIKNAPHFSVNGQIKDHLQGIPGACLQCAVIEGTVQPLNEPLTSHFIKDITGVLHKYTLKEHKKVWNRFLRTWIDSDRVVHERVTAIPFALVGPDDTAVHILHPLKASGVYTDTTHHKFHLGSYNFSDLFGQILVGEKISGQLETEEMLKVGTTLTGVGKLVLEADGTLTFGPPDNSTYILSLTDCDTTLSELESMAVFFKQVALAFTLTGAAVLLWVSWQYYKKRQREVERNEQQSRGAEGAIENLCVICLTYLRDCTLLDCGHVCCCFICYETLPRKQCPICRQPIRRVVSLYSV